jgi:hypothetical protein
MKLILNKNNIKLDNIILQNKPNGYKILYRLNNVIMNGIHIQIDNFNIYKNDDFLYIILSNQDNKLINDIIRYINDNLKLNICMKNNILRILNTNNSDNNNVINLNISNIRHINNKNMLYIYD